MEKQAIVLEKIVHRILQNQSTTIDKMNKHIPEDKQND